MSEASASQPVKAGWRTTEFWISLAAVLAGAVVASGLLPAESIWERIGGLSGSALAALGYTGARLRIKTTQNP
ncbi:MAG: hypothetical protein ACO31E_12615 [Phycisphaerales bacterium]